MIEGQFGGKADTLAFRIFDVLGYRDLVAFPEPKQRT